jgi:hypothetical protein
MADEAEVRIQVTRSGGVAGIRRGWSVESHEPEAWEPLVAACPWDAEPESVGADRFVWRIVVAAPLPARTAELPEAAVHGPWRDLVERVREEGEPVRPRRPRRADRG